MDRADEVRPNDDGRLWVLYDLREANAQARIDGARKARGRLWTFAVRLGPDHAIFWPEGAG